MPFRVRLKAIQHPPPWEKQGGLGVPINTPTSNMDEHLRALQHEQEQNAFLRYEARLNLAYARARNPYPQRWQSARLSRPLPIDCE